MVASVSNVFMEITGFKYYFIEIISLIKIVILKYYNVNMYSYVPW
jgi:hypothetical protein